MTETPQSTVLIVDDEPINIRQIGSLLESRYQISVATNGEQALKIAQRHPQPDLILLDIMMPFMDGYEVCKILKNAPQTCQIPIIFLTSNHAEEDEAKGLALGAIDYIKKPFRPLVDMKRIDNQIQLHQLKSRQLRQLVDALPWSIFVVDEHLSIQSLNQLAQQLLNDKASGFKLMNNRLHLKSQPGLLAEIIKEEAYDDKFTVVSDDDQHYRIFITSMSESGSIESAPAEFHQYIIYISRFEQTLQVEEQLKQLYQLTNAEARLANGIINGLSLEQIAEETEVKYSTLKSYLKVIFQKTGTNKQHELVSCILKNFTCQL